MKHYMVITLLAISLDTSSSLSTLHCDFGKILSTYSCNPISLNTPTITHADEEVAVNGTHLTGLKDDDITYVRFNSPLTLRFVPTRLFEVFPNIETFGLQSVKLTNLTSGAFTNCYRMKSLTIEANEELTDIPEAFAEDCGSLKNLYMPGNAIDTIDSDAFKGLDNLLYLVLTGNRIEEFPEETFKPLVSLQHLFIDRNRVKFLHADLFRPLRKLQLLSATHNAIEEISFELFRNNPILDSLFLDNNEIFAIDWRFFVSFPGERESFEIRFSGNNCTDSVVSRNNAEDFEACIENWNRTQFETSSTELSISIHERDCRYFLNERRLYTCVLESVDLVLTAIGGTHYDAYGDGDVTQVFFTHSTLSRVPEIVFEKFPNLQLISVAGTGLTVINEQTFGKCGRVRHIDASANEIRAVVETSLRNCTELLTIDLSDNPIEFVDGEIFSYDPQLKHIILHKRF